MENASVGRRAAAACVDIVLFFFIHVATIAVVIAALSVRSVWALVGLYAVWLFVYGAPEIFGSGTLGKRLLAIRVRDGAGGEASRARLALRWLLKAAPILGFFGLGFAVAFGSWGGGSGRPLAFIAAACSPGVLFLVGVADFLFACGAGGRALRDRAAGTLVANVGRR